jgi:hydroxyethylthiazole kinase-like sugar kinase family protein
VIEPVFPRRDFTKVSSALSINVGTALTQEWMQASLLSAAAAKKNGLPWVLDPVGVGVTKHRTDHCVELMKLNPTVVRGNASEIIALVWYSRASRIFVCQPRFVLLIPLFLQSGACGVETPSVSAQGCKGVDSTASSDDAKSHGVSLARAFQCIVAISGKIDYITDGSRVIACSNGTAMLTKITAAGCSLSCLCAAYCAVADGRFLEAVAAAFAHFGAAAEIAESRPEVVALTSISSARLDDPQRAHARHRHTPTQPGTDTQSDRSESATSASESGPASYPRQGLTPVPASARPAPFLHPLPPFPSRPLHACLCAGLGRPGAGSWDAAGAPGGRAALHHSGDSRGEVAPIYTHPCSRPTRTQARATGAHTRRSRAHTLRLPASCARALPSPSIARTRAEPHT